MWSFSAGSSASSQGIATYGAADVESSQGILPVVPGHTPSRSQVRNCSQRRRDLQQHDVSKPSPPPLTSP
ncbi:hypothetical protein TgHK011_003926 [Trichoderma gracile]|nr:hypothetical protein TgHK011_003926 [Trichoderma gracile]